MRTLVISDIHGCLAPFKQLLQEVNYKPNIDKLVLLGDYVDRGRWSKQVMELVMELSQNENVVVLRGNHDQGFVDALKRKGEDTLDDMFFIQHGGMDTLESYLGYDCYDPDVYKDMKAELRDKYQNHLDFIKSLPFYHETDTHIFVHAGIHPMLADWRNTNPDDFMCINRDLFIKTNIYNTEGKTVVFGHTPTMSMHETDDVWFDEYKIGIDGGYCFGGQLNCLIIWENGQYSTHDIKSNRFRR